MASSRTRSVGAVVAASALAAGLLGASLPGKNSVTSNDIGKGEIGKSELRTNSVGKAELRTGSVKGDEVDESTLGQVPNALRSDTSGRADSAATADAVGGKSAGALDTRWALIAENGTIERQTGGFTIVNCFNANANCYINAGEDVTNNGLHAQIAIANTDASPELSGETGVAPCGATFVACAPPGTESNNVIVVAPRDSDGTPFGGGPGAPSAANGARFYVFVTGSEG